MIETLFPEPVVTVAATPDMWSGPLLPEEEACLSPRAIAKRRREFTAGRVCARAALERLGVRGFPLTIGEDRAPVWPAGIVGAISHSADYCGVAVARRTDCAGLGLDVERARPLEGRIVSIVCTAAETRTLGTLDELPAGLQAMIVFSAKEAFYKAWHPLMRSYLDFQDVEIDLRPRTRTFGVRIVKPARQPASMPKGLPAAMRGRFAWNDAHVFSGVAIAEKDLVEG